MDYTYTPLITYTDVPEIPVNPSDLGELNEVIKYVQEILLVNLIGKPLTKLLITNKEDGDIYQALWEGQEYEKYNETIYFYGIKSWFCKMVVAQWFKRMYRKTVIGGVVLTPENATNIPSEILGYANMLISECTNYEVDVHDYIDNSTNFVEYQQKRSGVIGGIYFDCLPNVIDDNDY